jgi:hypothetical protein
MGFLSKLFRRKGGSDDKGKKKKGKKGSKSKHVIPDVRHANTSSIVATSDEEGLMRRQGSSENNSQTRRGSSSSREREKEIDAALSYPHNNSHHSHNHEQIRILSPRNNLGDRTTMSPNSNSNGMSLSSKPDKKMWNDETEPRLRVSLDENHESVSISPRLSYQELQQFNSVSQTSSLGSSHGIAASNSQPTPQFAMSSEIPSPQMRAMDDLDRSDCSSSSFNLSTDAEDSEYEGLRRRGVVPQPRNTAPLMDTSVMSEVSSPTTYATDDDRIFPALQTDDDMTQATEPSLRSPPPRPQGLLVPLALSTPDDEPGQINISPMNTTDSYDDMRAWNISPSTQASNRTPASREPTSAKSHASSAFSFQNSHSAFDNSKPKNSSNPSAAAAIRSFTSPKSQASSTDFSQEDDFANFADFSNFGTNNMEATPWSGVSAKANKPSPSLRNDFERNFESFDKEQSRVSPMVSASQRGSSTVSASQQDSSLSELLAQAKNKQKRNSRGTTRSVGGGGRPSSSSVNSAPAITASYLRQHHNLRSNNDNTYPEHEGSRASSHDATSVSDIIHSLEATNHSRYKPTTPAISSHRSMGDAGATNTARTVKERLREKRRNEREHGPARGLQKNQSSDPSSSENSGDDEPDSWLFDEVTGALGPRGIAADLESLSGRSNRSKSSNGNKSHKSRTSRSNSRRRPKSSSNESVDSRGSRTSRYSHRSTKSFLSQMSEQSRSVANDLLRLEMQLAMVGSQENRDDVPAVPARAGGSVGATSIGGASRASRTSRKSLASHRNNPSSISRRNKVTVVAPPGKIGIILANKADSKGTVVSGVRTSSVLAEKVSPGDRIIAIDGEDVSRMTVSEITTIMARKSEFERTLVVLQTPSLSIGGLEAIPSSSSPPKTSRAIEPFDSSYAYRR